MIDVRLGFRRLKSERVHTVVHVLGLTAGLVAASLAIAYVWYESTYDHYHHDADRVFRVVYEERARTPAPLAEALAFESLHVQASARVLPTLGDVLIQHSPERLFYEDAFFFADASVADVLDFPLVSGSWDTIGEMGWVVISE